MKRKSPRIRCTDLGNARRLVRAHGRNIRFCAGQWFVWNGMRWAVDTSGALQRLAKQTVESIFHEAAKARTDDVREELASWAIASQSERKINAMILLAQSEPGIPISSSQFDADPYQLNVLNGTIDLRTGKRHLHHREDMISKLAPVIYNPKARDAVWEKVVDHATGGEEDYAPFLARTLGYCSSGDISEEVLFFAYGREATCKSTIAETIKATLGDYALTADFETFIKRPASGGPRNDIARLEGSRFVCSIEIDDGKTLAQGLIKTITGGDTVATRKLYRESFEFRPTFKLWLSANHRPSVDPSDGAMWRRILQLPFNNIVPKAERDPKIKSHLLASPEHDPPYWCGC